MIKQEKQVLFKEKIKEGLNEFEANEEIKRDIDYCKKSKKIIKARLIDTKKLKENKDKQFKEAFKQLINSKESHNKNLDKLIRRVLNRLNESPTYENVLSKDCCMTENRVKEVLSLLIETNQVKILELKERGTIYSLN